MAVCSQAALSVWQNWGKTTFKLNVDQARLAVFGCLFDLKIIPNTVCTVELPAQCSVWLKCDVKLKTNVCVCRLISEIATVGKN